MPADTRPGARVPQHQRHRVGRRTLRASDCRCRQHILHRRVHQNVERAHRRHSPNQREWNVALRVSYLSRHHGQIVPTVVSPQRSHQRRKKPSHSAFRPGEFGREIRPCSSAIGKSNRHNSEDDRNLQQREQKLKFSSSAHPNVVQPRNQQSGGDRDELPVADREWMRNRNVREPSMREAGMRQKEKTGNVSRIRTSPVVTVAIEAGLGD